MQKFSFHHRYQEKDLEASFSCLIVCFFDEISASLQIAYKFVQLKIFKYLTMALGAIDLVKGH